MDGGITPANAYKVTKHPLCPDNMSNISFRVHHAKHCVLFCLSKPEHGRSELASKFRPDSGTVCVQVIEAGANALVAGSAVFGSKDYAEAIAGIKASKAPAAKEPAMA